MKNESGLRPLGHAVLVKPYEPQMKKSLIVMPAAANERLKMMETRAVVIEAGPMAWDDEPPRAQSGDKVFIARLSGVMVKGTADGEQYRLVNDNDIYCAIEHEVEGNE